MRCPHCGIELMLKERESVHIDYCPQCHGIWLDQGELDKIIERSMHHRSERHDEHHGHHDKHHDEHHGHHDEHHKKHHDGVLDWIF